MPKRRPKRRQELIENGRQFSIKFWSIFLSIFEHSFTREIPQTAKNGQRHEIQGKLSDFAGLVPTSQLPKSPKSNFLR